jgi:uncharacterized protein
MSCPICDDESDPRYRPFCSRRCADLDLGNWLSGRYSIPALDGDDDDDPDQQAPTPDAKLH